MKGERIQKDFRTDPLQPAASCCMGSPPMSSAVCLISLMLAIPPLADLPFWLPIAAGLLLLLLLLGLVLLLRRRRRHKPTQLEQKVLPPAPEIKVQLPPSEAERERFEQAAQARSRAEQLAQERRAAAQAAEAASTIEKARLEDEARALKAREEEAKREAYRAVKAAEQAAKERRRQEQEEQARIKAQAAAEARAAVEAQARAREEEQRRKVEAQAGQTLAQGLSKTRNQGFIARLNGLFGQPKTLDESVLAELEEILFTADIGVQTASHLVQLARDKIRGNGAVTAEALKSTIRVEIERILSLPVQRSLEGGGPPHVVMVVGVNGSGKTTTIGKLAAQLSGRGKQVILAAADTFRAAATEQLDIWASRGGAQLVAGPENADPGAVVFEALKQAHERQADVVIADTAGRLHTKAPLMEELKKVRRVMDKAQPGAPHEVLLVLDATTGQNAIAQARQFKDAVGVTGIALTKLDGTAKGGVIIGICDELKLPVTWIGIGEKVTDLRPFQPHEFVTALFE
jgi:fused signal recognition particle receptor